ncbi:hypothetical protein HLH34_04360 [Gluconacetobacter azotocaptans]|uniref:Phage protein n=1 Tax=Gluconacetobacter azotocaptans TaxID=142834 RepID=A0A7W4JQS0_9PROT|nr:hypothetical protein [Gluconacetobacter azotocaptans]MBB2189197.1 hypothetical protein [Gluconacetobacter azotocaptans]GBQ32221.1 hypothetical protein AA13594_2305 [Gluconacetobacter azotocaptans DSM 13594]
MNLSKTQQGMAARLAVMTVTHIRILAMPVEAIVLWQRLVWAIIELGIDGVLPIGEAAGYTLDALARFRVHVTETQLETYIETWAKNLAITYDPGTRTLSLPEELMPSRRAIASRKNGMKGGRRPKNRNPEPQNDPRQRTAMMPIPGGRTVDHETRRQTQEPQCAPIAKLASTDNRSEAIAGTRAQKHEISDTAFHRIGRGALDAAGFDPARSVANYGIVRQWLADALTAGLSEAEAERLILATIRKGSERAKAKAAVITTLNFFKNSIPEAIARRDVPDLELTAEEEVLYREAHKEWVKLSRHADVGPQPRREDFAVRGRSAA